MSEHVFKRPELIVPDSIAAGLYTEMRQDVENFVTFLFNQKDAYGNKLLTGVYTDNVDKFMAGLDARYERGENIVLRFTEIPQDDDDWYTQAQYSKVNQAGRFQEGDTTQSVKQDTIDFQIKNEYGIEPFNFGPGKWSPEVPKEVINHRNEIEWFEYQYGDDVDRMDPKRKNEYDKLLNEWNVIKSKTGEGSYQNYLYNLHIKREMNMGWGEGKETWIDIGSRQQKQKDIYRTITHELVHGHSAVPEDYYPVLNKETGELEYPRAEFGAGPGNLYGAEYNMGNITHKAEPIPVYNEQGHTVSYEYPDRPGASQEDFNRAGEYVYLKAFDKDGDGKVDSNEKEALGGRKFFNQMSEWINIANPLEKHRSKTDAEGNFVKGLNFVDRIVDPSLNIGREVIDDKGYTMSHYMGHGSYKDKYGGVLLSQDEGDVYVEGRIRHIVYPHVVEKTAEFNHYFGLEDVGSVEFHYFEDEQEAKDYALDTGEYMEFDSKDEAKWFSENYKKYWDLEGINPYK